MDILSIVGIAVIASLILLFFGRVFWRLIINYRIAPGGIEILLFHSFQIKFIPFSAIQDIQLTSHGKILSMRDLKHLLSLGYANKYIWGPIVVVKQKKGLVKNVLLTPDNPTEFINSVRSMMGEIAPQLPSIPHSALRECSFSG